MARISLYVFTPTPNVYSAPVAVEYDVPVFSDAARSAGEEALVRLAKALPHHLHARVIVSELRGNPPEPRVIWDHARMGYIGAPVAGSLKPHYEEA